MGAIQSFAAMQYADAAQQPGSELCRALDALAGKLATLPTGRQQASARDYAELREAKSLLGGCKYHDSTAPVRPMELAWALSRIMAFYHAGAQPKLAELLHKAAELLDIDLAKTHPIPQDLGRKISNELQLLSRGPAAMGVAKAG